MRPEIKIEIYNDDLIYKWRNNKARKNRRKRIQKAKRSRRRVLKENLRKCIYTLDN